MPQYKLNNEYHLVLFTLSIHLDQFEKEDQSFAAQCVWWLASIIQFMEILIYYRHYKLFPSEVVQDCVVTRLPDRSSGRESVSKNDIPEMNLPQEIHLDSPQIDYTEHLSRKKFLPRNTVGKFN